MFSGPNEILFRTEKGEGVRFCYGVTPWGMNIEFITYPGEMGYEQDTPLPPWHRGACPRSAGTFPCLTRRSAAVSCRTTACRGRCTPGAICCRGSRRPVSARSPSTCPARPRATSCQMASSLRPTTSPPRCSRPHELGVTRCDVVSHDVCGWIGFSIAAGHPEAVRSLALIETQLLGISPSSLVADAPRAFQ